MQEKRRSAWIVSKKPEGVTARFELDYKSNFLTLTQVARILIGDQFCDFVGYPKRKEIPPYRVLGRVSLFLVLFFTRFLRLSSWLLALSIRFRKTFYLNRYIEILGERPKFLLKHDPTTYANGKE
ncbi:hypothetical protein M427DRAFT_135611 [Gonapodya prolifera JEL478]|uniref:Uncharacterized protein n=1 Tax=Gonapodya prolifera (strain JEL478) TaxID=1344416 RepID=A0A139AD05_GONPJ|nr:hypothetical protein M427DRAFT_135611 [Gonapodya prolifera JEL478]|eukprot:KXS14706.1 hypothetical protein M427DRAFT_135611 [Gonapodya prolifera JEL478]